MTSVRWIAYALALVAGTAWAVPRTFVSATGSDANDCSRGTPCRSFGRALSITDAGGEVIALSSGAYDPFTITKAAAITVPDGIHATVTSSGPTDARNGVTVSAGPNDFVLIRGLEIDTSAAVAAASANGISYQSGAHLIVEDVHLVGNGVGYSKVGIALESNTQPRHLVVRNVIERAYTMGIASNSLCCTTLPDSIEFVVEDSQFNDNVYGGLVLEIKDHSEGVVRNSIFSGNGTGAIGVGIYILRGNMVAPGARITLEDNVATHNTTHGIIISGFTAEPIVSMARNVVAYNETGIFVDECPPGGGTCGGGTIAFRMGNNTVRENQFNTLGGATLYTGF